MSVGWFLRRHALTGGGVVLIVGGLAFWYRNRVLSPGSFGWYSYTPLADMPRRYADYLPESAWTPWASVGLLVAAIGLAMLTAGVGYRLGRRAGGINPSEGSRPT